MLHEESLDDKFLRESLQQEREWIDKFRNKKPGALSRMDTSNSSKFSFSTEYSSGMPTYHKLYRVSQEERTKLRESVPYVKLYRYNPKHLYPKLNGYGDNDQRIVWTSCISA